VGLTPENGPGTDTSRGRASFLSLLNPLRRALTPLNIYLGLVLTAGTVALVCDLQSVQLPTVTEHEAFVTVLLAVAVIVGELLPMKLRRGFKVETYTLSGTATIALIITGPLWIAIAAQISAGLVDDIRTRRSPLKIGFNASQYAIGMTASRVIFAVLSRQPIMGYTPKFLPSALGPALVAAFTFFFINVTLVAMVNAVAEGKPPFSLIWSYFRGEFTIALTLLAIAPVALAAINFSLYTLPLCVLPVLAVSGALKAGNRELMAMHDSLTGLPNRTLLLEHAENALRDRDEGLVALLFIDLDHFKQVNDAMGHPVGDELLRVVGHRLANVVRAEDFAARLGGDEFAVLCEDLPDVETALALATRISSALSGPVILQDVALHVEASVGVALSPTHAHEVDVLLQRADVALYQAKATGPGSVVLYDPNYDNNSVERLTLMAQLRSGLEDELVLHYQPKCRLSDGEVVGVEALVRWQHPTLGLMAPPRFLTAAENTGLMMPLTIQVLRQALAQWREWHEDGLDLTMSVNISARNIHFDLPTQLRVLLDDTQMPGKSLLLEVTESAVISDVEEAGRVIQELLKLDVGISIDDFGTGHTSLAYMKDLSATEVKIDQSFVSKCADSPRDAAFVRASVELGRSLGMQVVAEGVETPEVLRVLTSVGCDLVQGHLILPPVPGDELAVWSRSPHTWSRARHEEVREYFELEESVR
jgi:diguanylate cyclase (GGDEF)-like protein